MSAPQSSVATDKPTTPVQSVSRRRKSNTSLKLITYSWQWSDFVFLLTITSVRWVEGKFIKQLQIKQIYPSLSLPNFDFHPLQTRKKERVAFSFGSKMKLKPCKWMPVFIPFHVIIWRAVLMLWWHRNLTLTSAKKFSRRCLLVKDSSNYKEFPDSRLRIRVNQNLLSLILILIRDRQADIMYIPWENPLLHCQCRCIKLVF